jgi:predicted metal-dependent RNase
MSKPLCELIKTLNPGTKVNALTVQGTKIKVCTLVNYNESTRLATFINSNENTVIIDCDEVAAIEIVN